MQQATKNNYSVLINHFHCLHWISR